MEREKETALGNMIDHEDDVRSERRQSTLLPNLYIPAHAAWREQVERVKRFKHRFEDYL